MGFPSLSQAARLLLSPPQNYFHSVPKWQLGTEADSRTLRPLVHLSILYLGYQNSLYLQSILCSLVHQVLYSRVSMLLASLFSVCHELYLVYACVKHVRKWWSESEMNLRTLNCVSGVTHSSPNAKLCGMVCSISPMKPTKTCSYFSNRKSTMTLFCFNSSVWRKLVEGGSSTTLTLSNCEVKRSHQGDNLKVQYCSQW